MICNGCVDELGRLADPFDLPEGEDSGDDVETDETAPDRVTSEQAFDEALADKQQYDDQPDGTLRPSSGRRRSWQP